MQLYCTYVVDAAASCFCYRLVHLALMVCFQHIQDYGTASSVDNVVEEEGTADVLLCSKLLEQNSKPCCKQLRVVR